MRVLVTGGDGFIGSHLVERLLVDGHDVRAVCIYNSAGSYGWLDGMETHPRLEARLGDVRDSRLMEDACRDVDTVYHLAALIAIPYSYQAPESFVDTNVKGALNILEGARKAKVRRVVHTSTSEVYGTPESLPVRETHPLKAQSPYAASKIAADALCQSYAASFDTPVVIVRPFNTYGPRQSMRAVLMHILTQLLAGVREVPLGNIDTRRDLTYVTDTVDGIVRAAGLPPGETVHLGTGVSVSIAELFALCCDMVGGTAHDAYMKPDETRARPRASEVMVLLSDPFKASFGMGWKARVSLADGIKRTVEWLRSRKMAGTNLLPKSYI